jgi:hypothetical protein
VDQSNALSSAIRVIIPPHWGHRAIRHSGSAAKTVAQVGHIT